MKDDLHLHRALKELQDYRNIGSVEELRALKSKDEEQDIYVYFNKSEHCPRCDHDITQIGFDDVYCSRCGQKLKKGD